LKELKKMKTLDIGCGGSEDFRIHKVRGDVNCDILKPAFKIRNFVLCDAHHLPFEAGSFSKVFMYEVLEHLESPFKALKNIQYVLKRGGRLSLTTPNGLHILKIARSVKRGFYSPHQDHVAIWNLPELKILLQKVGFKEINIQYTYRDRSRKLTERFILFLCKFKELRYKLLLAEATRAYMKPNA